jgi:hypothetical protein
MIGGLKVSPIEPAMAAKYVVMHHYLHRRPPISYAFGLLEGWDLVGVLTLGTPASRETQKSVCPSDPSLALELNRLWVHDRMPRNTETYFMARALKLTPPRIVFSYADTAQGHQGYVYRAANWWFAGVTDEERKTPRFDYVATRTETSLFGEEVKELHTRDAFRGGAGTESTKVRRKPKMKYWTVTGNRRERHKLKGLCGWPQRAIA